MDINIKQNLIYNIVGIVVIGWSFTISLYWGLIILCGYKMFVDPEFPRPLRHFRKKLEVSDEMVEDEFYEPAKKLALETGKVSASILQRRLKIGYARAARLLDMLEDEGIIGEGEYTGLGNLDSSLTTEVLH